MRLSCYITAVMAWATMIAVLLLGFGSAVFGILFLFSGIAASVIALLLALSKREIAIGFGTYGILQGITVPLLFGAARSESPTLSLIIPALAISISLRAIMMTRRRLR